MFFKVAPSERVYITKKLWLPQRPLERFNFRMGEWLDKEMPDLPAIGQKAIDMYPALQELTDNHDEIKNELQAVISHGDKVPTLQDVHPRDKRISSEKWRTYIFKLWGNTVEEHAKQCPKTFSIITGIPGVHSALFSILRPGTVIPPHRGWAAGVVRCHYPLVVPKENSSCYIRVNDERHVWEEGQTFLFNDTHNHEVENKSDEMRVVLIIDFEPPFSLLRKAFCKFRFNLISRSKEIKGISDLAVVK